MNWAQQLVGQLEFYWDVHLRPRLDGLTDDEYWWEPVPGSWGLTRDPGGEVRYEAPPESSDAVITTLGWRMMHVAIGGLHSRASTFFGDGSVPDDADMFDPRHVPATVPATASEAIALLERSYRWWHDGVASLDDEAMAMPLGPRGEFFADEPMAALVAHISREVMHHGGEIGLLRDLYRARDGR